MTENIKKIKERILAAALDKFRSAGFYKTTVDEIAALSGVSKNTMYKYFSSKENLAEEMVETIILKASSDIRQILKTKENAITKFQNLLGYLTNSILKYHDTFLVDLKIYLPEQWNKIDKLRSKIMYANLSKLIRQGKSEKLFLDYHNEIILAVFIGSLRTVANPAFILNNNFTADDAVKTAFDILINGILTQKGKNIFKKLKNNKKNEEDF